MSAIREAFAHILVRVGSAVCSSALFALVARRLGPDEAQHVYFFVFSVGFLAAFLRSFAMLQAGLHEASGRIEKLRLVDQYYRLYHHLMPYVGAGAFLLLLLQPVPAFVSAIAAILLALIGFDLDQTRAALFKSARFTAAFALGNASGLTLLLLYGSSSELVALLAFLVPWIPMAALNGATYLRVVKTHVRLRQASNAVVNGPLLGRRISHTVSALAFSIIDGAILNFPFVLGLNLPKGSGLDLSVASRLFSSAQPLFPLIMHWSASGRLRALAARRRASEAALYFLALLGSACTASLLFVAIFNSISGTIVSRRQFALFCILLVGYSAYATAIRYRDWPNSRQGQLNFASIVGCCILLLGASSLGLYAADLATAASMIVCFQGCSLLAIAIILFSRRTKKTRDAP